MHFGLTKPFTDNVEAKMSRTKSAVLTSLFIAMLGVLPLLNALANPRFGEARGHDFLQLIAAGFCFGVSFGMSMVNFGFRRRGDAT